MLNKPLPYPLFRSIPFRSKHSTQQALITRVDRVTKSLDRSNNVVSLFMTSKSI